MASLPADDVRRKAAFAATYLAKKDQSMHEATIRSLKIEHGFFDPEVMCRLFIQEKYEIALDYMTRCLGESGYPRTRYRLYQQMTWEKLSNGQMDSASEMIDKMDELSYSIIPFPLNENGILYKMKSFAKRNNPISPLIRDTYAATPDHLDELEQEMTAAVPLQGRSLEHFDLFLVSRN